MNLGGAPGLPRQVGVLALTTNAGPSPSITLSSSSALTTCCGGPVASSGDDSQRLERPDADRPLCGQIGSEPARILDQSRIPPFPQAKEPTMAAVVINHLTFDVPVDDLADVVDEKYAPNS